ncbi:hypothetical protein JAAARDRAFT_37378 [Jaapia argillacea MUCL 33604]|uniref:Protein kinase domain-containing protein n=1 Tax=Jaapia argillacea MUCL 33604 TaxID=933084 RepID=A0A067PYG1_9AGAM|nr:hypothetical protein JAAARDRAFT_37378 [Jaapia argillacea MUCL 33604]
MMTPTVSPSSSSLVEASSTNEGFRECIFNSGPRPSHEQLFTLPDESQMSHEEFCFTGSGCTDLYRGKLGAMMVMIKAWRGASFSTSESQDFTRRLLVELKIWRSLSHPSVVSFLGLTWHWGQIPSMVFPFYKNGNIMSYLKSGMGDGGALLLDVASALVYMHNLDPPIAHGDIKGSNILISDDGHALLTDLGLGSVAAYSNFSIANIGSACRWLAPEIIYPGPGFEGEIRGSREGDVYSFGMTVLEVFTGEEPFANRKYGSMVVYDVINGRRPPRPAPPAPSSSSSKSKSKSTQPTSKMKVISDDLWSLIESCWVQEPEKRPGMGTVAAWLEVLTRVGEVAS